jgi:hypothetical protein
MATLAQLRSEPYWDREIVTVELDWLGDELCRRTGRPRAAAGTKGDENHDRGAHRSQEWIKRSRYCTNRTYTVQGGLTATQERHVAGFDFTPGSAAEMVAQCRRIYNAVRAGRLEEVREFYGNVNGDRIVDGWDNVDNEPASADSSHLWHWHLSIDRRRLTDRALMERILAVALGEDDDMTPQQLQEHEANTWQIRNVPGPDGKRYILTGAVGLLVQRLIAAEKKLAELAPASGLTAEQWAEVVARAEAEAREEVADLRADLAALGSDAPQE